MNPDRKRDHSPSNGSDGSSKKVRANAFQTGSDVFLFSGRSAALLDRTPTPEIMEQPSNEPREPCYETSDNFQTDDPQWNQLKDLTEIFRGPIGSGETSGSNRLENREPWDRQRSATPQPANHSEPTDDGRNQNQADASAPKEQLEPVNGEMVEEDQNGSGRQNDVELELTPQAPQQDYEGEDLPFDPILAEKYQEPAEGIVAVRHHEGTPTLSPHDEVFGEPGTSLTAVGRLRERSMAPEQLETTRDSAEELDPMASNDAPTRVAKNPIFLEQRIKEEPIGIYENGERAPERVENQDANATANRDAGRQHDSSARFSMSATRGEPSTSGRARAIRDTDSQESAIMLTGMKRTAFKREIRSQESTASTTSDDFKNIMKLFVVLRSTTIPKTEINKQLTLLMTGGLLSVRIGDQDVSGAAILIAAYTLHWTEINEKFGIDNDTLTRLILSFARMQVKLIVETDIQQAKSVSDMKDPRIQEVFRRIEELCKTTEFEFLKKTSCSSISEVFFNASLAMRDDFMKQLRPIFDDVNNGRYNRSVFQDKTETTSDLNDLLNELRV